MSCTIRLATADDLPAINAIYNHFVLHSTCTYQEEPSTAEERRAWFVGHGTELPVTVATLGQGGPVVGWGSLSKFHPRSAYRATVENSLYVHHDHHRKGIGAAILTDLIARGRAARHRTVLALISADQTASVALHAKFRFERCGYLRQVGNKFGRWLDVVYMQLML